MNKPEEKEDQGIEEQIDFDPEFHEMDEDFALDEMKKSNPKLHALMTKHGAETDEELDSAE